MRTTSQRVLGCLLLLSALFLFCWQFSGFLAADACLDSGGSYNYAAGACDFTNNHAYQSSINFVLFGFSLLLASVGAWLTWRRRARAV